MLALFLWLSNSFLSQAQPRTAYSIDSGWLFQKDNGSDYIKALPLNGWESIELPHCYNIADTQDDTPGYYQGPAWYHKALVLPVGPARERTYLQFDGANQVAEVYVNGHLASRHAGGYTTFRVPISEWLRPAGMANEVLVKVDNSPSPDLAPLSGDFTFYGGLYRAVTVLRVAPVHFDLADYGADGVFVSTPAVSAAAATVQVRGAVVNESTKPHTVIITQRLLDAAGQLMDEQHRRVRLAVGQRQSWEQAFRPVRQPQLWSPAAPYLYRVVTRISEAGNAEALDEVSVPLGLRWFRFDAAAGFFLNGQPLKLIGASRHQDFAGLGNALPDALHEHDVQLLKEMGGNFLRIAHYPQAPAVLRACDRLGILVSEEIPVVNQITPSAAFTANCQTMLREMIRQHHNHPSVIIWTYMNEVLLRRDTKQPEAQQQLYLRQVARLARTLDSLARREDPTRATMLVMHGDFGLYQRAGLTRIPQVVGWNLYSGWYSGQFEGFGAFLDRHHQELPDKPLLVTEYGADADYRLHALAPLRFDKAQEYALLFHQAYLAAIRARPFVAGAAVWNLADFGSESRQEANPHLNTKGLLTFDRQLKDSYLFYQANLLQAPFVRIGGRGWRLRSGPMAGPDSLWCRQPVTVFSNQPAVALRVNGREFGTQPTVQGMAVFQVPFADGRNWLETNTVGPGATSDAAAVDFQLQPVPMTSSQGPFKELNVSLGDQRYFCDEALHQVWVPEQPYQPGSWGYVGGEAFRLPGNSRLPYGSDRDILGTDYDAVYETQRVGIEQFRLDVPAGEYELTLHFAELQNLASTEKLVYNLDAAGAAPAAEVPGRRFGVRVNGQLLLSEVSAAAGLLPQRALRMSLQVRVAREGLKLEFPAAQGAAILNGLQVKRLD